MAKIRITFEVDQSMLFDRLREMGGNTDGIGNRMVMAVMPAETRFMEDVGMAIYGITVTNREDI